MMCHLVRETCLDGDQVTIELLRGLGDGFHIGTAENPSNGIHLTVQQSQAIELGAFGVGAIPCITTKPILEQVSDPRRRFVGPGLQYDRFQSVFHGDGPIRIPVCLDRTWAPCILRDRECGQRRCFGMLLGLLREAKIEDGDTGQLANEVLSCHLGLMPGVDGKGPVPRPFRDQVAMTHHVRM